MRAHLYYVFLRKTAMCREFFIRKHRKICVFCRQPFLAFKSIHREFFCTQIRRVA